MDVKYNRDLQDINDLPLALIGETVAETETKSCGKGLESGELPPLWILSNECDLHFCGQSCMVTIHMVFYDALYAWTK